MASLYITELMLYAIVVKLDCSVIDLPKPNKLTRARRVVRKFGFIQNC